MTFRDSPKPDNGENASRQDYKITKVVPEGHPREHGKRSVECCTHSAIDGDNEAHDRVSQDAGADGHSPIQADLNHR